MFNLKTGARKRMKGLFISNWRHKNVGSRKENINLERLRFKWSIYW